MTKLIDPQEPIAIIGLGSIFPGAKNTAQYWNNLKGKVDSIIEVPKDRWDWRLYYDADRSVPDKTYSKLGGFVLDFDFDPLKLRIPPTIAKQMDSVQQMAVSATAEALADAGYDKKEFDRERTAVIFGNAMGGPKKEESDLRVYTFRYLDKLKHTPEFGKLSAETRTAILTETENAVKCDMLPITEDTMPGELSNVIAGRIANIFNVNGANFTVDAACAASLGALAQAINGLRFQQYDMVITGGIDQMMAAPAYVKFAKIGALSPDGSRPFDAGANGFIMGEGAGVLLLKRLSDAKRDGDKIYALVRSVGASSDGKGKGITAPNPKGQLLAMRRAFEGVDYTPADVGLLEAHGTSTAVGDVVEVQAAVEVFSGAPAGSIALGSVKSQIGHLKAAAGAASLVKVALALHHKKLPPSINFQTPNPGIDWGKCPFYVNTEMKDWDAGGKTRRANVSAFGFGGTNFHITLEEANASSMDWKPSLSAAAARTLTAAAAARPPRDLDPSLGGEAFFVRGDSADAVFNKLDRLRRTVPEGPLTRFARETRDAQGDTILAIAAESGAKLREKIDLVFKHKDQDIWAKTPMPFKPKAIRPGKALKKRPKIAFLFPGQGSQYVDMIKDLAEKYQVVADTFEEADAIMERIIGEKLTDILFTQPGEGEAKYKERQERIKQTEITQPAVLTADVALLRLIRRYGVDADVVAGHSLGEYGALVAAGVLEFEDALLAVSARGKEMAGVKVDDNGKMAFVAAPLEKVEKILEEIDGYVIPANKNCPTQTVIAGRSQAVDEAVRRFKAEGLQSQTIEVSHAFHSKIVAPATEAYGRFLKTLKISAPKIPVNSNVTAGHYPKDKAKIRDLMTRQISAPVEFIRQVERMYQDGVRVFIEVGPKRALTAFVTSTLADKKDVVITATNHPKRGGIHEFNDLLATLAAAGIELDLSKADLDAKDNLYTLDYADWAARGGASKPSASEAPAAPAPAAIPTAANAELLEKWDLNLGPVVVSGIAAGAPGKAHRLFRENAMDDIIDGNNLIDAISPEQRGAIVDMNVERLAKSETGAHAFERLDSIDKVLQLAGQAGEFDIGKEFGIRGSVSSLMDVTARMGLACGILALKDAGLPLQRRYKKTTTGSMIPTHWALPEAVGSRTGVIMASAFPGIDSLIDDISRHFADKFVHRPQREMWATFDKLLHAVDDPELRRQMTDWYAEQRKNVPAPADGGYKFSRSFLFRALSLGHAQTAQHIGAKGPCTQINAACASTTQGVGIAEDWIRTGRAERVLIISCDDITNPTLMPWLGAGFLASGATSTHNVVGETALPFDKRRHGMIVGMGVAALVIESGREVAARGMQPLAEILATQFDNSAFHVTRLQTHHVAETMSRLLEKAERRHGISRSAIAGKTLFMSHETYTPAQGGSSAAEVEALKAAFGPDAAKVIVTNTKGFTGHAMGASLEDVIAIRAMNVGKLPPIANYKEPDPELSGITLSKGGAYDCEYALRLAAGFGSQIALTLMRGTYKVSAPRIADAPRYQQWLKDISALPAPQLEVINNTLRIADPGRKTIAALPAPMKPAAKPAPVPAAAPAPQAAPVSAANGLNKDVVTKEIIALVTEKTGYPQDMLELDLDMEADLGIDTVKQAEMIGLIRDKYNIPKTEDLSLKDYPTLTHVIGFVMSGGKGTEGTAAVAAAPAPAPVPAAAPAPAAAKPADEKTAQVTQEILDLVAEKTGYPQDMLELDLDMEADLGIDTVKQAEMIGLIRDKYNIPKTEDLSLKDYPTLTHVIGFVMAGGGTPSATAPTAAPIPEPAPAPTPEPAAPAGSAREAQVTKEIIALVEEKTGYPQDMLELDLDMEADLGIDTVKQAEMIGLIRDKYNIPKAEDLSLKDYPTLRHVIGFVMAGGGTPSAAAPTAAPAAEPAPAPSAPVEKIETPRPAEPAGSPREAEVTKEIVALVEEKTGYPQDMLELDLDMEADLGIDTVKQAEMIGLIRDKYNIPKAEDLSLKDYPTLRHVIGFVMAGGGSAVKAEEAKPAPAAVEPASTSEKPKPSITSGARFGSWNLEAYPLSAGGMAPVFDKKRAVVILAMETETAAPYAKAVEKLGGEPVVVKTADWETKDKTDKALRKALGDKKPGAIMDVTALDLENFDELTASGFDRNYRKSTRALFLTAQALYQDLKEAGPDAWIVVVTQMGGTHGCGATKPFQPMSGAQTGLAKNLSHEFGEATVRIVDFDHNAKPTYMAATALTELGSTDPRREVGYRGGKRHALRLVRTEPQRQKKWKLTKHSVVVITGGSGALGSTIAKEIAQAAKCTIFLMDIAPLPQEATVWARLSAEELKALKAEMWTKMKADKTRRATPAMLEREFSDITRAIFLHRTIEDLIRMGAKANYLAADLTDGPSVTKAIKQALKPQGRIDFILHAGGLEESKLLPDKDVVRFDRVFRPKAHGAFNLLKSIPPTDAQRWVFFSSVASRFGNLGQADYSSACDLLAKVSAHLNASGRSGLTYALTAFGEIGMATRGGIAQFLKSMGVDFLPPSVGIPLMLEQMTSNTKTHETLIAGALGKLDSERIIVDPPPPPPLGPMPDSGILFDQVLSGNGSGAVTAKTFSLESDPWLLDHSIDGTPWVSGVMGLELFAETIGRLTGEVPAALADIRFGLPIKLLRNKPITVRTVAKEADGGLTLAVESDFISPKGEKLGDTRTHYTARTASSFLDWGDTARPAVPKTLDLTVDAARIYQDYFHGPSYQVLAGIHKITEHELLAIYRKPKKPLWADGGRTLVFQPLLIEAAFQACGYRDLHFAKKMSLPDSVGRVQVFRDGPAPDILYIHVRFKGAGGENKSLYDAFVFDERQDLWAAIEDYRMIFVT
ncbi:MAG: SDR family NAD(P)-dependent oxidoreductase [Elusimicrobiota bacterium]